MSESRLREGRVEHHLSFKILNLQIKYIWNSIKMIYV